MAADTLEERLALNFIEVAQKEVRDQYFLMFERRNRDKDPLTSVILLYSGEFAREILDSMIGPELTENQRNYLKAVSNVLERGQNGYGVVNSEYQLLTGKEMPYDTAVRLTTELGPVVRRKAGELLTEKAREFVKEYRMTTGIESDDVYIGMRVDELLECHGKTGLFALELPGYLKQLSALFSEDVRKPLQRGFDEIAILDEFNGNEDHYGLLDRLVTLVPSSVLSFECRDSLGSVGLLQTTRGLAQVQQTWLRPLNYSENPLSGL